MNEHEKKVLFSSKSDEWETPSHLFQGLNKIYKFNLDPASTEENHLCDIYFTQNEDGLKQSWSGYNVFLNPPYGRSINKWVKKIYEESLKDKKHSKVLLIPARTETKYFADYCSKASNVFFIKGRLKFNNRAFPSWREDGSHKVSAAPFPSSIVVFDGSEERKIGWVNQEFTKFW